MTIVLSILAISTAIYLFFLLMSMVGLFRKTATGGVKNGISIIIPFRNEKQNLSSLQKQLTINLSNIKAHEVIWIDDHSEDGGVPDTIPDHHVIKLPEHVFGKKAAINAGIHSAKYESVISLDADIDINEGFIEQLLEHWTTPVHICPVIVTSKGMWSSVWALESYALCGLTVGMAKQQKPIMNNGAAWAFKKKDWENLHIPHLDHPSGDDIFTLEAFKKSRLTFSSNLSHDGVVRAEVPQNLISFINQRVRWAGKSAKIRDLHMTLFGLSTFLMYLTMIIQLFYSLLNSFSTTFISIIIIKYLIDFSLLFLVSVKAGLPKLIWAYPILAMIYPFYTVLIAILSLFYTGKWKGR